MGTLLVVDDEPSVLHLFRRVYEGSERTVATADSAAAAIQTVRGGGIDVVVLDVMLPDRSGLETFTEIRQLDAKIPVIFITAGGNSDTAIEAMKRGALDYLVKPLDFAQVRRLIERAFEIRRLMVQPVTLVDSAASTGADHGDLLVGKCPAMQEVYKAIGRVASQNVTVLIRGESGTGKELVARALYQHGDRAEGPFMAVNCAAIPEPLLESELFGHERGAFTGADRRRIGKFEQSSGGTLFLDEIGDMTPTLQSKMLRILQEQHFERVGGNETIATDVRIIAATNRNLERMVSENEFRSDLYYRLNGYSIFLPPLRQRGEDLQLLIDYFLARTDRDLHKEVRSVSPAAREVLRDYHWPGNIRELQSVIRQAVLQTSGPVLLPDFLPDAVQPGAAERLTEAASSTTGDASQASFAEPSATAGGDDLERFIDERLAAGSQHVYDETLARIERRLFTRVLRHVRGNQAEAARLLGITRTTLRARVRQLNISIDRVIGGEEEP